MEGEPHCKALRRSEGGGDGIGIRRGNRADVAASRNPGWSMVQKQSTPLAAYQTNNLILPFSLHTIERYASFPSLAWRWDLQHPESRELQ